MAHTLPQGDEGRPSASAAGRSCLANARRYKSSFLPRGCCVVRAVGKWRVVSLVRGAAAPPLYVVMVKKRHERCAQEPAIYVWCARECIRGVVAFRKRGQCAQGRLCAPNEYVALTSLLPRSEGAIRWQLAWAMSWNWKMEKVPARLPHCHWALEPFRQR